MIVDRRIEHGPGSIMRSISITVVLGLVLATAAYGKTADGSVSARVAGTLSCVPVDKVSLVFGGARAAACVYVSASGSTVQRYGAILPARTGAALAGTTWTGSPMTVWRVTTAGGTSRPGMLDGAFASDKPGNALRGGLADLLPVGLGGETQIALAADEPAPAGTEVASIR